MAELKLSVLSRIYLARKITDMETLISELDAIAKESNKLEIKVKWQFTIDQARQKLGRHYDELTSKN